MPDWQKAFCEAFHAATGEKVYHFWDIGDGRFQVSFDGGFTGGLVSTRAGVEKLTAMFRERVVQDAKL